MGDTPAFKTQLFPLTLGQMAFVRTDDGTTPMNVNGLAGGTPLIIWDGESSYWTPSGEGIASAAAAHSGSLGWDTEVAELDREPNLETPPATEEFARALAMLTESAKSPRKWLLARPGGAGAFAEAEIGR